ncbi:hypothetical protein J4470_03210 [Candidatus Woesearchaeota archaeon]|nr:hypothetical protein [Candidatus Woesearchaeota archaeon]
MKEREEPVYVGIEEPAEIRRALLESSKSLIKILQQQEMGRQRREQKHRLMRGLKATMKELTRLLAELKSQMPKVRISSLPKKPKPVALLPQKSKIVPKEFKRPEAERPREMQLTEAQKLERELKDIEDKLSKLG